MSETIWHLLQNNPVVGWEKVGIRLSIKNRTMTVNEVG